MLNRSFRPVAALGLSIALMLATGLPAAADGPTKTEYSLSFTGGELTNICVFPIFVDNAITITQTDFVDKNGTLIRQAQHGVQQDTFYANGKTLVGLPYIYNVEFRYDSRGNVTSLIVNGIVEKVPLPDGSLFISAGKLNVLDHPGQGFFISPDKGHSGDIAKFCAALAP